MRIAQSTIQMLHRAHHIIRIYSFQPNWNRSKSLTSSNFVSSWIFTLWRNFYLPFTQIYKWEQIGIAKMIKEIFEVRIQQVGTGVNAFTDTAGTLLASYETVSLTKWDAPNIIRLMSIASQFKIPTDNKNNHWQLCCVVNHINQSQIISLRSSLLLSTY